MGSGFDHAWWGYAVMTTGLSSSKAGFSGAFSSSGGAAQAKRRMPLQSRPNTTVKIPKTAIVACAEIRSELEVVLSTPWVGFRADGRDGLI